LVARTKVKEYTNSLAPQRAYWINKNRYYYSDLLDFYRQNIPPGSRVLEIGCGTGFLIGNLLPKVGVGIDISPEMISLARKSYPGLTFQEMDAEGISLDEKFEFIIISDTLGYFDDVQRVFQSLQKVCTPSTRIIINYHSYLWLPLLNLAELMRMKMPSSRLNWLNHDDIAGLLSLSGFEVVKSGKRFLFPKYIPLVSMLINRYVARLPFFEKLCITNFLVARPFIAPNSDRDVYSVSVIIPARNEAGNIENAVARMPKMGKHTEIVFVEGHSTDGTLEEIRRVCQKYAEQWDLKYATQEGKGKGDAVRKGFAIATGDILMILDADLTVPPEDLTKFYGAIASGKGEFINGSRLVYPLEDEAMRGLNILGNKFFSLMFTWLLGQRLKDTLCGTKVLFKKDYERIHTNRAYFGDFDPFGDFDLIFGASKINLRIVEVPVHYKAREYGVTNISRFSHGWLLFKMMLFAMNRIKFT
jgi:SAM-dependent methyltransferase